MRNIHWTYYPHKRCAYGPRSGRPHRLVEDCPSVAARDLPPGEHVARVWVPMPYGGARVYALCPRCDRRCERLYETPVWSWQPYLCRRCAGLVYWRQYDGRRPEADSGGDFVPARALWAMLRGYRGWRVALLTWQEREAQHDARAWAALAANKAKFALHVARCDYWEALARHAAPGERAKHEAKILDLTARIRELDARAAGYQHAKRPASRAA